MDQVLLFRQQVLGHAAVALPSVSPTVLFAGAGDHVPAAAIVAEATTGDVIYDHAAASPEAAAARAGLHDLAARLMAGHHALIAFRPLAQVLMVDGADIRAANGGGFHANQYFTAARRGDLQFSKFHGAVAG